MRTVDPVVAGSSPVVLATHESPDVLLNQQLPEILLRTKSLATAVPVIIRPQSRTAEELLDEWAGALS